MINEDTITNSLLYHQPEGNQADRYAIIRDTGIALGHVILRMTPSSREQSLAITKLEECIMWANKAIAVNEP